VGHGGNGIVADGANWGNARGMKGNDRFMEEILLAL